VDKGSVLAGNEHGPSNGVEHGGWGGLWVVGVGVGGVGVEQWGKEWGEGECAMRKRKRKFASVEVGG
jgi:hypothetical protein